MRSTVQLQASVQGSRKLVACDLGKLAILGTLHPRCADEAIGSNGNPAPLKCTGGCINRLRQRGGSVSHIEMIRSEWVFASRGSSNCPTFHGHPEAAPCLQRGTGRTSELAMFELHRSLMLPNGSRWIEQARSNLFIS
jgi:hypothetical protein